MADQKVPPPLRSDAKRAELYNDGLAVYLYDLSFREALRAEHAWKKIEDGFQNSKPDKTLKQFLASKRVVAYELFQDDSVVADVCVGPPLSKEELKARKGVKWHKPQVTLLDIPSGKLCVESANSCRIGEEEPTDKGAVIDVLPGEYVLTLHRIDWAAMPDEASSDPKAYGETITLTPLKVAEALKKWSAVLAFPQKKPKNDWIGAYTIEGAQFTGKVAFADPWEFYTLNLDRAAFGKLNLAIGAVLQMTVAERTFSMVYLGDAIPFGISALEGFKQIIGKERMTAKLAEQGELAIAVLRKPPDVDQELLSGMRVVAKEAWPKEKEGKWLKMSGMVLPDRLQPADSADFGQWTRDGDAVKGTVLLRSDKFMTLNLDAAALEALQVKPGDKLRISAGGLEQTALLVASPADLMKAVNDYGNFTDTKKEGYNALLRKVFDMPVGQEAPALAELKAYCRADPPVVACLDKHWLEKDKPILLCMPLSRSRPLQKIEFALEFPVKPGDSAVVRKA